MWMLSLQPKTALTFDLAQKFVGIQAVNTLLPVLGEEPLHAGWFCKKKENNQLITMTCQKRDCDAMKFNIDQKGTKSSHCYC